ncbi:AAA family ATPase [Catenulispora sp. GP43]|uniref:ATP-binding protein n=1 Tax=Catenulispora sp. GP43 TaxID=3156263 RepID=UPI003513C359
MTSLPVLSAIKLPSLPPVRIPPLAPVTAPSSALAPVSAPAPAPAPKLAERETLLAELEALLAASRDGGRIAWVTGEAGIGKSTLVRRFAERHRGRVRILSGCCDPAVGRHRGRALWRDLAGQAGLDAKAAKRPAVLADGLADLARGHGGLVVVLEDLHWADEAVVDMVTAIGRRLERCRALFILTCRTEQGPAGHRLGAMLAAAPAHAVAYLAVPPLSPFAVAELARHAGRPEPDLYRLSGGNPLLANEILASGTEPRASSWFGALAASRMGELRPAAQEVARLVALAPDGVEPWLLEAVRGGDEAAADQCLASGLLVRGSGRIDFRHGILKQVVRDLMPLFTRRALHRDLLRALVSHPDQPGVTPARLVFHAIGCDDGDVIRRHAPHAARDAAAFGAPETAIGLYETALAHTDPLDRAGRGELLDALAEQAYLSSRLSDACAAGRGAASAWEAAERADRAGRAQRRLARALWLTGDRVAAWEAASRAVDLLLRQGSMAELALAHAELSRLEALVPHPAAALESANLAIQAAERADDPRAGSAALIALGSAKLARGEADGQTAVARGWLIAVEHGLGDEAGCAAAALAGHDIAHHEHAAAAAVLDDGLHQTARGALTRFAQGTDNLAAVIQLAPPHHSGELLALRSWLRLARGDWRGAQADADESLHGIGFAGPTAVPALSTLARLRARRGLADGGEPAHRAVRIAEAAGGLQAVVLATVAEAEHFWLSDRQALRADRLVAAFGLAWRARHPWFAGELAWWLRRAGTPAPVAGWFAEPYRLLLAGEWRAAARAWAVLGCGYEQAEALACSDDPGDLALALDLFSASGADPLARRLRRRLRGFGGLVVQRGPRPASVNHPAGLTSRQAEVLTLLSAGLSNAAIAERLSVSTRTAEHHVAAVLTKLAVTSRRHAADAAARLGLRPVGSVGSVGPVGPVGLIGPGGPGMPGGPGVPTGPGVPGGAESLRVG